jgi:hypothetical protein
MPFSAFNFTSNIQPIKPRGPHGSMNKQRWKERIEVQSTHMSTPNYIPNPTFEIRILPGLAAPLLQPV